MLITKDKSVFIACGVLKNEIQKLIDDGKLKGKVIFLDSLLHMNPKLLKNSINSLEEKISSGKNKILIYGDCHPTITDKETNKEKVNSLNCIEMVLGKEEYKKVQKEKIFCFLPEWAKRWKKIFENDLGFNNSTGIEIIKETIKKVLYIDTGLVHIPYNHLNEFKSTFGLDYEIKKVNLNNLLNYIKSAEENLYE